MGKTGGRFPPSREHKKYATATLLCGAERAARAWQLCRRHRGQPLTDADGQVLEVGSTVVDSMFGEGMARGTVPLEKGDRVNVQIDCGSHEEPSKLDDTLVGSSVYMRWEKYGWQLGRITDIVTNATPRVFNYRIIWADGSKGPAKLCVENYGHGSDARYNSWAI